MNVVNHRPLKPQSPYDGITCCDGFHGDHPRFYGGRSVSSHLTKWIWPLNDPDIAVCVLTTRIPSELSLLTERETACLRRLARGMSTRDISKELEIGLTTVHTHLRRSREKLGLPSGDALIGFAARYFFVPPGVIQQTPAIRKRSG
jgi:DNA-binding CsgD family transcriptional regulator